jgi:methylase of polypeptide subunit release factors
VSVARHHTEWLSLLEVSGPFLSLPVLLRVFPQGLDDVDRETARNLRLAFEEWEASGDRAIHHAWLEYALAHALEYPPAYLLTGQTLPASLEVRVAEHGETVHPTWALQAPGAPAPQLLIAAHPPGQDLDAPVPGVPWKASPATRMLTLLLGTGVPLGLVTNGEQWMLVAAERGQAASYVTWQASLWGEEPLTLRAFRSLLGARRFFGVAPGETLSALLAESLQNQQEVTEQLGLQVRKAVEVLVQALDRIDLDQQGHALEEVPEKTLYEAALTVMMRLVFLLSAEERGLLLLGDPLYDRHYAVSTLRDQLREVADSHGEEVLERRHDAWGRLLATFRAIHGGVEHEAMRLPAYGGGLFDPDRYPFLEGRRSGTAWRATPAEPVPVNNRTVLHLLEALQFLQVRIPGGPPEARRLSFRALDIEQIGHVYEGLLDHTAVRARSVVLGLVGAAGEEPEVSLDALEAKAAGGEEALVTYLREETGRSVAALRRGLGQPEPPNPMALQVACGDADRYRRVAPFAHLLREDTQGYPVVILPGSVFVTAGADRRSTGTHYTPRTLTEPVVKATLDPLLYRGFEEGVEPSPATLRSPEEILALRLCDLACGSGAFLVQACRYMAERLVEAWALAEQAAPGQPLRVPEAGPSLGAHHERLLPRDDEERLAIARRLVAERCLYGVDVNPLAVEMAKLSLWLVTLQKSLPFTFLDHALRSGDSLLGLHRDAQIRAFHLRPERVEEGPRQKDWITGIVAACEQALETARTKRERLERFTALDIRDSEHKARLHREAETATELVRVLGDILVGAGLATAGGNAAGSLAALDRRTEELSHRVAEALAEPEVLMAAEPSLHELRRLADSLLARPGRPARRPFHWLVEFPEVFLHTDNPGFHAIVGNPPFVGGQKITGLLGTDYRDYQVLHAAYGRRGSADLCAYFFLRAAQLLRRGGNFGLLAVNTIAEGDTRQVGLEAMLKEGLVLYAAWPNQPWPGDAAVVTSQVHLHRGPWRAGYRLSGQPVPTISAFLSDQDEWSPKPLRANANRSFQGSIVLGLGFTMTEDQARALIDRDPKNAEVLFPYLNGEDLNSHPDQRPSRWVINFWDWPLDREAPGTWTGADEDQREKWLRDGHVPPDYPGRVAADFPEVLEIVRRLVKPERERNTYSRSARERWWLFERARPELYHAIGRGHPFARHPEGWDGLATNALPSVLAYALVSKHWSLSLMPNTAVFTHMLGVNATQSSGELALMQSLIHTEWARKMASSLETRLRYTPSDIYETFPFPAGGTDQLAHIGEAYHALRASIMQAEQIGLTDLYNRFHDPACTDAPIAALRDLHRQIDEAVLAAYGWTDIPLGHGFHAVPYLPENDRIRYTIAEEARLEILRRLARLNRERYEQEQAEAERQAAAIPKRPKRTPAKRGRPRLTVIQGDLF